MRVLSEYQVVVARCRVVSHFVAVKVHRVVVPNQPVDALTARPWLNHSTTRYKHMRVRASTGVQTQHLSTCNNQLQFL